MTLIRQHDFVSIKVTINATLFYTTSVSVKMDVNGGELSMKEEEEEEYVSINDDTCLEDVGHFLYHMDGVRLNKNDALMMTGLRYFQKYEDLELLKSKYPHTLDALAGFLVMIDYRHGKTTIKDLHKLTTVLHRLNLGERTKTMEYQGTEFIQTFKLSFKLGPSIAWNLIERIWYTTLDVKNGHIWNAESVYQILSDNARQWRGPSWQELQRFEQAAERLVDGVIEGNLFSATLRDGRVTALRYLPTETIIMGIMGRDLADMTLH